MKNTVIVEFNGLPGLGKTTVANAVIGELKNQGYTILDKSYKRGPFGGIVHYCPWLFNRSLYKHVLSFANSIPPERRKRTHVNWTLLLLMRLLFSFWWRWLFRIKCLLPTKQML